MWINVGLKWTDGLTHYLCPQHRVSSTPEQLGPLTAYRYEFEKNAMDNGVVDERNKCFCRTPETCLPSGLLDVSDCYYGFPIALSYPHFLDSDERIREHVLGSQPNRSAHSSYVMIQPVCGYRGGGICHHHHHQWLVTYICSLVIRRCRVCR